ncbi:PH domain-containing protein [Microbacterium sp. M3]|uniref:PH domain-containing protein n=1 Tax=Microbacterium arthrosphaerae TaxID=792652 RepID=A0ABU4H226_9MICO|nr:MULTISPECIES: PH domain-containing protein [Microbacterium]MDW4573384.1 PH domain-containing protein [Microbacterium arthrosphaerae]MDW7607239.1 PH domain-containing protein [Microbacterium sp. M3]
MTQPTSYGGRPLTPAPGAPTPELLVARFRGHARRLTWSALVLIAIAGACGYFYGNLPAPFENWMLLAAAAAVILLLVVLPYLSWLGHVYTITTRRVMERRGVFAAKRRELAHVRGYTLKVHRGPLQRMWGAGTITLANGIDEPLRLADIPTVELVHEALVDQVEVNQILAHRDAQPLPPGPPPPVPPQPVAPPA